MRFSGATARLSLETPPMITTLSPDNTSFTWPFSHPAIVWEQWRGASDEK
jgi:hypothetical protein